MEPSPDKNIHVIDWANPVTDYKVIREATFEVLNELGTEDFSSTGADTLEHLYGAEDFKRIIGRLAKMQRLLRRPFSGREDKPRNIGWSWALGFNLL